MTRDNMGFVLDGEARQTPYPYRGCGLDGIYLLNGYRIDDDPDYGPVLTIRNLDGLHRAIGEHIVLANKPLAAREIRFLRKQMDLSQKELGARLGVSDQQIARWEKDISAISGPADRLLKILYLAQDPGFAERFAGELTRLIGQHDTAGKIARPPAFFELGNRWHETQAAA